MTKHLRLMAAAIAVALIGLTAFAALPAYAGGNGKDKGSDKANEKSGDGDKDESGSQEQKDDPQPQAPEADSKDGDGGASDGGSKADSGKGNGSGGGAAEGSAAEPSTKASTSKTTTRSGSSSTTTLTLEQHCPDHALLEAAGYKFGPGGGTTPDGVTVTVSGTSVTFSSPVTFCVKAGDGISGVLTGSSYTVDFLNNGGQFPGISHLVVYPSGPCVDDPTTTEDECDPEEPPCVDDESTPEDECDEEEPPCVDDINTPDDECNPEDPPCVDDMDTPEDECAEDEVGGKRIDRPGDPGDPVSPEFRPRVKGAALPFTGGDVFAIGALALALIASGGVVMATTRRRQRAR